MILPVIAFVLVALLVPFIGRIALKYRLVDRPGGRKVHRGAVPLVGGVCIIPVFMALSLAGSVSLMEQWPFFLSLALILVTGLLDDRFNIGAWPKFFAHVTAALLTVIVGGAQIHNLGNLFALGDVELGFMALPFSLAAMVLLINALNLIDGVDGLAGGVAFVMLGWMAFAGGAVAMPELLILMGALAGFLIYNIRSPFLKKARAFLGDAGSLSLGFCTAWYAISLARPEYGVVEPIAVAWIMAHPIFDVCAQFYRRVREGRHPFSPDRGHFHHHFLEVGLSPGRTTMIILLVNLVFGAIGVLGTQYGVPLVVLTLLWIAGLLTHMTLSRKPEIYINLFKRLAL